MGDTDVNVMYFKYRSWRKLFVFSLGNGNQWATLATLIAERARWNWMFNFLSLLAWRKEIKCFLQLLAPPGLRLAQRILGQWGGRGCLLQKIWIYPAARQRKNVPANGGRGAVGVVILYRWVRRLSWININWQ